MDGSLSHHTTYSSRSLRCLSLIHPSGGLLLESAYSASSSVPNQDEDSATEMFGLGLVGDLELVCESIPRCLAWDRVVASLNCIGEHLTL